ncbi:Clp protease ClpP [Actimicrobium sp. CCC2.4]|jgi:ATP-dependent Clp protease protease subunit|uniref:head maturation protease, ClpP-related n=1 Tax=Actimicrobium sp. CCC2.4 TaxID=3048606 RepID=UPI002AC96C58|nr:head maturation protease, ClpP-related [Actimicrobium sp. CCC2.4]MEB0133788.1 Clp protease ClpP [Actimicrobium sp. CCC2.4]WPX31331.1 Clp protease ClpP [Actimicrobium sp. CCC2.4]
MNNLFQLHIDNLARTPQAVNLVQNADGASLYIYDVISADWGVSAAQVIDAINQAGDAPVLNVYLNSPGGDVFEGRAIMAALDRFPGKTVAHIDSLCASAATSIALACNEINMSQGALFMIHNASGMAFGDKKAMRDTADILQKIELSIIADYTNKTGKPDAEIIALMDSETWMTADEALANGFIDNVIPAKSKTKNTWNLGAYKNAPTPDPQPEPEPEPAPVAGFFMSSANANRLSLIQIL